MEQVSGPADARPRRGPLRAIFDLFNSVWLGIALMVLIFAYMTVASAGLIYPVDWSNPFGPWQRWEVRVTLGLTEMEAFTWWPFNTLIALFVTNMVVVTVRRIRLTLLNAGVWAIHGGIVILALGSLYYFSTKLEGDTLVYRRNIVIQVPGAPPARLVVQSNASTGVSGSAGAYQFAIQEINPHWPLLSGDDAGKTACSVNVAVTTPNQSFIRQMLIGYPQYTEDILPGQGRAIKAVGRKLLDEDVQLAFEYEPQTHFYLQDSAALYVREVGSTEWIERPIEGLPHYADRIASRDLIWQPEGDRPIKPDPLDIHVPPAADGDPLGLFDVQVTGRLHYVEGFESRWVPGGDRRNPLLTLELVPEEGNPERIELLALQPGSDAALDGMIQFAWADRPEDVERLAAQVGHLLEVEIPEENVRVALPVDDWVTAAQRVDAPFEAIGGSAWSYRVLGFSRKLELGARGAVALASVEFRKGDETIKRFVFQDAAQTHDRVGESGTTPDPRIVTRYRPGPALLCVGGPDPADLALYINDPANRVALAQDKPVKIGPGMDLVVRALYPSARLERRLAITPTHLRDADIRDAMSRIQVEISQGAWRTQLWLPFHQYPFPDRQYAGRFFFAPQRLTLPGGRQVELLFSRKRWPLPAAVTLEDFELQTHIGGFVPGNTTSVRDFVSRLRSYRNGAWSEVYTASLNEPASEGGLYYFQSTWDPGTMAYTGLGVGNRRGVYIQLFGCCVSVAGMIWVFYVKPVIKRRRRLRVLAQLAQEHPAARAPETVGAT